MSVHIRSLLVSAFFLIVTVLPAQNVKQCVVKFRETGVKYSQLNEGYIQGYFTLFRETGLGYAPTIMENEFAVGYSPWRKALTAEANHRHVFMIISFGAGAGYCTSTDFSRGQFFFKPEVGLNLFVCQIYYTYSFTTNNYNLYTSDSNLTLAIPFAFTTHFGSCEKTRRWKMWGVMLSVIKGETWQIWE